MLDPDQDHPPMSHFRIDRARWVRVTGLLLILFILVWLPVEDTNLRWVYLFALSIVGWAAAGFLTTNWLKGKKNVIMYLLAGIVSGFGVTVIAVFLMIFKIGIHGHATPDFTFDDILFAVSRFYIWVIAGFIIALGLSISKFSFRY